MNIFYQYSSLKTLRPTKGDQINEINTLKALSSFASVYYSGQLFNPDAKDFGLVNYDGEIKITDADVSIIRANKKIFLRLKGKRFVVGVPYDKESFSQADGIIAFTDTWAKWLMEGKSFAANPDGLKWPSVITFHQTLMPTFRDLRKHPKTESIRQSTGGTFIIGVFGRITKPSYPYTLIKSLPLLKILIPRVKILLGVTRSILPPIKEGEDIRVTRFNYEDMPYAISACNCIISSNTEEGWEYAGALRIIEAMACGTPVICQRSPAREEMLGEDYPLFLEAGVLTSVGSDSVRGFAEMIAGNPDLKRGKANSKLIERSRFYSFDNSVKRIKELLLQIL